MKERPILFSAPMVRALLEGRKTQTRRIVKPQPDMEASLGFVIPQPNAKGTCAHFHHIDSAGIHSHELTVHCPYGMPGDQLWVKETWAQHDDGDSPYGNGVWYRASDPDSCGKWRSSMFMPRKFSRILLEITAVRVERLQDISEEDAIAEGCAAIEGCQWHTFEEADAGIPMHDHTAVDAYAGLWESINGDGSWDLNPYVWVIEFRRTDHAK